MGAHPRRFYHVASLLAPLVALLALLSGVRMVSAQITQVYTFEDGGAGSLEGFHANGGGTTISLEPTIGVTEGMWSMKFDIVTGATFVGTLVEHADLHAAIGDPPGMEFVLYDLTITEQFPGNFADAGITIFGDSQPDFPGGQLFGIQAQFFLDQVPLGDLAAGTHTIQMNLFAAPHPLTFVDGSFNDIMGTEGSGANDIIPTGFQIYINKSADFPWTGYIDNIRVGTFETADFNKDRKVDGHDFLQWQRSLGIDDGGDTDNDGDTDALDLAEWESQYGGVLEFSGISSLATVPEPTTVGLACTAMLAFLSVRRKTS